MDAAAAIRLIHELLELTVTRSNVYAPPLAAPLRGDLGHHGSVHRSTYMTASATAS